MTPTLVRIVVLLSLVGCTIEKNEQSRFTTVLRYGGRVLETQYDLPLTRDQVRDLLFSMNLQAIIWKNAAIDTIPRTSRGWLLDFESSMEGSYSKWIRIIGQRRMEKYPKGKIQYFITWDDTSIEYALVDKDERQLITYDLATTALLRTVTYWKWDDTTVVTKEPRNYQWRRVNDSVYLCDLRDTLKWPDRPFATYRRTIGRYRDELITVRQEHPEAAECRVRIAKGDTLLIKNCKDDRIQEMVIPTPDGWLHVDGNGDTLAMVTYGFKKSYRDIAQ